MENYPRKIERIEPPEDFVRRHISQLHYMYWAQLEKLLVITYGTLYQSQDAGNNWYRNALERKLSLFPYKEDKNVVTAGPCITEIDRNFLRGLWAYVHFIETIALEKNPAATENITLIKRTAYGIDFDDKEGFYRLLSIPYKNNQYRNYLVRSAEEEAEEDDESITHIFVVAGKKEVERIETATTNDYFCVVKGETTMEPSFEYFINQESLQ